MKKKKERKYNRTDDVDKFLLFAGFFVPYYWLLRYVRRNYFKGIITETEANDILVNYIIGGKKIKNE